MKFKHKIVELPNNQTFLTLDGEKTLPLDALRGSLRTNYIEFLRNPNETFKVYRDEAIITIKFENKVYFILDLFDESQVLKDLYALNDNDKSSVEHFIATLKPKDGEIETMSWDDWYDALVDWKNFYISQTILTEEDLITGNIYIDETIRTYKSRKLQSDFLNLEYGTKINTVNYLLEKSANKYLKTVEDAYDSINGLYIEEFRETNEPPINMIINILNKIS